MITPLGPFWGSIFILDLNLKPIFGLHKESTLIQVEPRKTAEITAIDHHDNPDGI